MTKHIFAILLKIYTENAVFFRHKRGRCIKFDLLVPSYHSAYQTLTLNIKQAVIFSSLIFLLALQACPMLALYRSTRIRTAIGSMYTAIV